jgi:uncharacterized membrane protein required for colicin V production
MQTYDLVMLGVLVLATLFGAWKGLAWQVASIASIFVSFFVAVQFREPVARLLSASPPWNKFLAMLILFLGCSLLIWVVFRFVSDLIDRVKLKEFDRHAGAVLGLARGVLWCVIITLFAVTLLGQAQQQAIVQSRSGHYIALLLNRARGDARRIAGGSGALHPLAGPAAGTAPAVVATAGQRGCMPRAGRQDDSSHRWLPLPIGSQPDKCAGRPGRRRDRTMAEQPVAGALKRPADSPRERAVAAP